LIRGTPAKRPHGEGVVIPAVINLKLIRKVFKGIKGMGGILVWMVVRPSGTIAEGIDRAVITPLPAVDILSVCLCI
jgi:hypothetical protein